MPLINEMLTYTPEEVNFIDRKLSESQFSHTDWQSDEFEPIRKKIRDFYRVKQSGFCAYCKNLISLTSPSNAHVEHIVPKSLRVEFIFEPKNLCVVCADCNTVKRNQETLNEVNDTLSKSVRRYPRSSKAFRIVHPHFDNYDDHILKKGTIYIDKTAKGNFTIGACKLNRYFHKFGVDDKFIDDQQLILVMERFINGRNSVDRSQSLDTLLEAILSM